MHPLLHLIATQPQLLAEHAQAYADLVADEVGRASGGWKRRVLLTLAALCCLVLAAGLAGVALMLWAIASVITPVITSAALWALVLVPLLPAAIGAICLATAQVPSRHSVLDTVRRQAHADMALLREVAGP